MFVVDIQFVTDKNGFLSILRLIRNSVKPRL